MSGAAGLAQLSADELRTSGEIFGVYRDRISAIAVVASAEVHDSFAADGAFGQETGLEVRAWHSHADAREWLAGFNTTETEGSEG